MFILFYITVASNVVRNYVNVNWLKLNLRECVGYICFKAETK